MTESDLLNVLEYYELGKSTLQESIEAEPERAMEKISTSSHYNPEFFSSDVIDILVSIFELNPKRVFHILQIREFR